jgi:hypothetical protein
MLRERLARRLPAGEALDLLGASRSDSGFGPQLVLGGARLQLPEDLVSELRGDAEPIARPRPERGDVAAARTSSNKPSPPGVRSCRPCAGSPELPSFVTSGVSRVPLRE